MNVYSTAVPLITFRWPLKKKLSMLCGLLLLGIYFCSSFWWENNLLMIFFFGGIIVLWISTLFKDYDQIGLVILDLNKIVIKTEGEELLSYDLQDLKEIKIVLLEIKGEFYSMNSPTLKQGSGNYIKFNYHGEEKRFQFLLEEPKVILLRAIFEGWKGNGIKFKISNGTREKFST